MATKLNTNVKLGGDPTAKLWAQHQKNEYTHVDHYKEALCFMCWKKKAALATLIEICSECMEKKGAEPILAAVKDKIYGQCYKCGLYKMSIFYLNVRICMTCHGRIAKHLKNYNKSGGPYGNDPFYKHLRRKLGKDWKLLYQTPSAFGL